MVLLNAATGAGMVLPGRAADLRMLHVHAGQQFFKLLLHYGFDPESPACAAELLAWESAPVYAATADRSLLASMNRFKDDACHYFAYVDRSLPEAAASQWEELFTHPSFVQEGRARQHRSAWRQPLELVRARLTAGSGGSADA